MFCISAKRKKQPAWHDKDRGASKYRPLEYSKASKAVMAHIAEDDRMKCTVTDSIGRKLRKAPEFKHRVTVED